MIHLMNSFKLSVLDYLLSILQSQLSLLIMKMGELYLKDYFGFINFL